jgi:hypothetical protein
MPLPFLTRHIRAVLIALGRRPQYSTALSARAVVGCSAAASAGHEGVVWKRDSVVAELEERRDQIGVGPLRFVDDRRHLHWAVSLGRCPSQVLSRRVIGGIARSYRTPSLNAVIVQRVESDWRHGLLGTAPFRRRTDEPAKKIVGCDDAVSGLMAPLA